MTNGTPRKLLNGHCNGNGNGHHPAPVEMAVVLNGKKRLNGFAHRTPHQSASPRLPVIPDGYEEFARAEEAKYAAEYDRWIGTLSEVQRKKLTFMGVDRSEVNDPIAHGQPERDVSEWHDLAAPSLAHIDDFGDFLAQKFGIKLETAKAMTAFIVDLVGVESGKGKATLLNRIVGTLLRPGNPVVRIWALAFASGLNEMNGLGHNQVDGARRIGTTRSNFNKEHRAWMELLELPRSSSSKSDEARARYSKDKKAKHWRHKCNNCSKTMK